ncbi:unnamed protein product [Anisakis simplex]|uniref:Dentin sialophosphoprotein-like n=1 Tax=Anisakis simplex TaxID=6269 RepID=A0A0M3K4X9_ANISI|nr:unnamed protein product [Anisakis simplex]
MGWSSRGRLLLILCSIQIAQCSRSLRRDSGYQPKEGDTLVHEVRLASFDESTSRQQSTQPLVNNIVIQVYLNAKNTSTIKSSKAITSGLNIGQSPLGSPENPIIISKDFDREALKFIDEENVAEYNPTNMVEIKAVVYGVGGDENRMAEGEQMEKRINKEFQSSIPAIRERLSGLKKDSQLTENHFLLERLMKKRETDEQTSIAADQPISLTGASDTNESVRDEPSASEDSEVGTTRSFDTMRISTESTIVEGVQVLLDAQTETTTIPIQQTSTESGLVDRVEVAIESAIATTTAETDTDRNTFPNEVIKTKTGILEMSEEEEPSTVSILDLENVETTTTLGHSSTEAVEMATEQFTNGGAESEVEELGSLIVLESEFDSTESDSTTVITSNNVPVESEVTSQSSDTNFDTFFNSRNGGENNRGTTGKSASSDSSETKSTEGTPTSQETSTTTRTTLENTDAMLSMETVGLQGENVQKTDGISSTSVIPTVTDASVLSESGESGLSRTDVETLGGERLITSETRQEGENKGISSEGATEKLAEQTSQSIGATQSGGLEVVTQTFDTSSTLSKTTLQVAATAESDGITTLIPEADEAEEGAENSENNRQTQTRTTTNAPQTAAVEPSSQGIHLSP